MVNKQAIKPLALAMAKTFFIDRVKEMVKTIDPTSHKHPIERLEMLIEPVDMLSWLSAQPSTIKIYGHDQKNFYAIAGVDSVYEIKHIHAYDYKAVFENIRSVLHPQHPHMQIYGGFCFDPKDVGKEWANFGTCRFVLPRFELAAKDDKMLFACNINVASDLKDGGKELIQKIDQVHAVFHEREVSPVKVSKRIDVPTKKEWANSVNQVLNEITQKKIDKVVLARQTSFECEEAPNALAMVQLLKDVAPHSYVFCFQMQEGEAFVGASPERLYQRVTTDIISEAIAGTRPRGEDDYKDRQLKEELRASIKDQKEHAYVVDEIKDGLSSLCVPGTVQQLPTEILSITNGHHLITRCKAHLRREVQDEDIMPALHPTPAVGGVNRLDAVAKIRELEPFNRGWYAGPVGFIGREQAEFVVAIRSALIKDKKLLVYAGAGIVEGSEPEKEWYEIENKISNFLKIIGDV